MSNDGYHWKTIHNGRPFVAPQNQGELMRDIFITRGPDNQFHAVWTWGWRERKIGYAESDDLIHWSPQREIPLMADVPGTVHTDLKRWTPITDLVEFPKGCKHGSFLKLTEQEVNRLEH